MISLQMFRFKVFPSSQADLFSPLKRPGELLRETLEALPEGMSMHGKIWHVGNATRLDENGIYFRVGRTSPRTLAVFQNGAFTDQEFETAPYTHAILDTQLEVCAIAKKTMLAPTASSIARQLARLCNESRKAREFRAEFEVGELKDPTGFISHIREAYAVSKFWVDISKPNAFDVDAHFLKPLQHIVTSSNADSARAELKGESLSPDTLEPIARSAAATGDNAAAWVRASPAARPLKKQLRGNPVSVAVDHLDEMSQRLDLLAEMRKVYYGIREGGEREI